MPIQRDFPMQAFLHFGCMMFFCVATQAAEVRVGLARTDLTPPVGGLTTGYSSAEPTDGIHDPVSATVVLFETDQQRIALVSCDLCIFNSPWLHEQMPDLGVNQLLLHNTHTHAGPRLKQLDFPTTEEPWKETVERRLVEAIKKAKQETFAASFAASKSHVQLGYNRLVQRNQHAETYFDNPERIPYGSVDPTVAVLRISDEEENVRAVLVNYACHPVVLGPRNRKISADYPGVMRERVEASMPGEVCCVFLQGGGGDINPLMLARGEDRENDFKVVQAMGELLAAEVQRALALIKNTEGSSQSFQSASTELEFRNRWDPEASLNLGVTTLLINNSIAFVTLPGEPFHQFQLDFHARAGVEHCFFLGYCCNGPYQWPSYLPDLLSAARGGYGASDTTVAEVGAGERLLNHGLVQLFHLQGRLKSAPQRHTFENSDVKQDASR